MSSPLISCNEICKSHGSRDLFRELSVALFAGDRVGLIGPNGAGKSTLLKILAGIDNPDTGTVVRSKGLLVGYVPQQVEALIGTVEESVFAVANKLHGLSEQEKVARVREALGSLGFSDFEQPAEELSGGRKRRLTIAQALVSEPDILLLDEPTNHLDLESIEWLERFLQRKHIPFIVTSHDRVFLDNVSNRVWEISHRYPRGIFTANGSYSDFLEHREDFLQGQLQKEKGLRSKVRREEEWLRQSPKARTTKARSRIQETAKLQHELASLKFRNRTASTQLDLADTGRQTKKLLAAKNISKTLGEREIFSGLELILHRGDRLGITGINGSGKSTLIRVLAGELESDTGTIKYADGLQITLFDQHREKLDLSQTLRFGLAPDGDHVTVQGHTYHVNGWCERFLFSKDRLDLPMSRLSGGERARVLIARMMTQPADLLLLDEPTNDLDIETLEILEESLDEFPGAVVLITHDRAMMDRVVDKTITIGSAPPPRKEKAKKAPRPSTPKQGLTYNDKRDLASLERRISKLESKKKALAADLENPEKIQETCEKIGKVDAELEAAYADWEKLEEKR